MRWTSVLLALWLVTGCVSPTTTPLPMAGPTLLELYRGSPSRDCHQLAGSAKVHCPSVSPPMRARPISITQTRSRAVLPATPRTHEVLPAPGQPRLPNPDLIVTILAHTATEHGVVVPTYVTYLPLYQRVHPALPGEATTLESSRRSPMPDAELQP